MPSSQQQEARSNHSVPVNKCSAGSGPEVLPLPQPAWSLSWGWGVRSEVSCELLYFRSGWACRRTFQTHSLTLQAASGSKPPHTHIFLMFVGEFRSNTRRSYSFHTEHIPCRFPGFHIPVQSLGVRGVGIDTSDLWGCLAKPLMRFLGLKMVLREGVDTWSFLSMPQQSGLF